MWQRNGMLAQLKCASFLATIDLRRPDSGVSLQCSANQSDIGKLWKLWLPRDSTEVQVPDTWVPDIWVRGHDLVAVYPATPQHASRAEIYWRFLQHPSGLCGMELIVSIQTELLEDCPTTRAESDIEAADACWLNGSDSGRPLLPRAFGVGETRWRAPGPGMCLVRCGATLTYLELVHPSDFDSVELLTRPGGITIRTELFPDRLEKGVIRRSRLRGWLLPTSGDAAVVTATALSNEFSLSEPPLTA